MAASAEWVPVPDTPEQINAAARQCRRMVTKRTLLGAGVALVPVPGVGWVTDIGVPMKLIPDINRTFGLMPEHVEQLAPERRLVAYTTISARSSL